MLKHQKKLWLNVLKHNKGTINMMFLLENYLLNNKCTFICNGI